MPDGQTAGAGAAGAATGAGANAGAGAAGAGAAAGTPWYEGKAETSIIGLWDNKAWDKTDPAKIAIEASKAYGELNRHFGVPAEQLVKLPTRPDDPEWGNVWARLGRPAEAKDYDLAGIKYPHNNKDVEPELLEAARAALHKANVPKDAAPELLKGIIKHMSDEQAKAAAVNAGKNRLEIEALQKDWGKDFDFNRLTAAQGARRLGIDEGTLSDFENMVGYGKLMEMLRRVGANTSEDAWRDGGKGGTNFPTTRAGAQAEFERLSADQTWVNKVLAGSIAEKQQFEELMKRIGAEELAA